jgi:hypothetical protein
LVSIEKTSSCHLANIMLHVWGPLRLRKFSNRAFIT